MTHFSPISIKSWTLVETTSPGAVTWGGGQSCDSFRRGLPVYNTELKGGVLRDRERQMSLFESLDPTEQHPQASQLQEPMNFLSWFRWFDLGFVTDNQKGPDHESSPFISNSDVWSACAVLWKSEETAYMQVSANCKALFEWNNQGSTVGEDHSQERSLVFLTPKSLLFFS